jgi:hypothetical protein
MTRASLRASKGTRIVERVQTGVRLERHMLKVLKALAEYHDMTLGDLIEGIVLHAFEGRSAFGAASLERIHEFKRLYGLSLDASHSHRLIERARSAAGTRRRAGR